MSESTISHNASDTLDKKHGDGTISQEVIKIVTELIKPSKNIKN